MPTRRPFRNWSGVHRATPSRWATPSSEEQVAALVREADRAGRRVKAVGSGHSWSDIAVPDDVLVDLRRMRRVLAIDAAASTIRVQAGIRLEELTETLDAVGMAMPILGSIAKQTIAGATSTGTHGSSLRHGNLATLITAMRLVTARGEVLVLDAAHPLLPAARVGLGALGIVTEVTLRVGPAFRLEESLEPMAYEDVARDLRAIAESAEFVKIWWFPSTGRAQVFRYRRTPEDGGGSVTGGALARWIDERVVNQLLFEGALRLAGRRPELTSRINDTIVRAYFRPGRRVARSDRCFNLAMPPIHRETEYAIAIDDAPAMLREVEAAITRGRIRVNFPCEIRFVRGDDAWMSPAYGRDTCQIGFYQAESPDLAAYFGAVEELARARGGRPHWGKEFSMDGASVLAAYPMAPRFLALRAELDPNGTLENAFTRRVLSPS